AGDVARAVGRRRGAVRAGGPVQPRSPLTTPDRARGTGPDGPPRRSRRSHRLTGYRAAERVEAALLDDGGAELARRLDDSRVHVVRVQHDPPARLADPASDLEPADSHSDSQVDHAD